MTYNVFGGTLNVTQSINLYHHDDEDERCKQVGDSEHTNCRTDCETYCCASDGRQKQRQKEREKLGHVQLKSFTTS